MENILTESLEDYLLESYIVGLNKGVIRLKDIAERKGVKPPSAVNAIKELSERGFLAQEKYGYIVLTKNGREEANKIYKRHNIIFKFLHNFLGIDETIAEKDAHKIEHDLHRETLDCLTHFVKFLDESYKKGEPRCFECIKKFSNKENS